MIVATTSEISTVGQIAQLYYIIQKVMVSVNNFATNRVYKINPKTTITWRHVPFNKNPVYIWSRGIYSNRIPEL